MSCISKQKQSWDKIQIGESGGMVMMMIKFVYECVLFQYQNSEQMVLLLLLSLPNI